MELYKKYRPKSFDEMVGNTAVVNSLREMITSGTLPHSILFTGGTGCGKTTLARIIANELGVIGHDFHEVDSGQFRGIDTVRQIGQYIQYQPIECKYQIWLLDEVHMLGRGGNSAKNEAQNALLKMLEDTPPYVYFILCTTDPQNLIKTIKGRCVQFELSPLDEREMTTLLRKVSRKENQKISKEIYEKIFEVSNGHPRNALQLLEKVLRTPDDEKLNAIKDDNEIEAEAIDLARALLKANSWAPIKKILKNLKNEEPEKVRRVLLGYCSSILLNSDNTDAGLIMEAMIEPFYNTGFPGLVFACYSIFMERRS